MTDGTGIAPSHPREPFRRLAGLPFHPLLFFLFPVVSLLGWNIQELYPDQAVRSLGVSVAAAALLWMILAAALRNPLRAAILATLVGIFLFSYSPLYEVIEGGYDPRKLDLRVMWG